MRPVETVGKEGAIAMSLLFISLFITTEIHPQRQAAGKITNTPHTDHPPPTIFVVECVSQSVLCSVVSPRRVTVGRYKIKINEIRNPPNEKISEEKLREE